jgi:hypothetical protein
MVFGLTAFGQMVFRPKGVRSKNSVKLFCGKLSRTLFFSFFQENVSVFKKIFPENLRVQPLSSYSDENVIHSSQLVSNYYFNGTFSKVLRIKFSLNSWNKKSDETISKWHIFQNLFPSKSDFTFHAITLKNPSKALKTLLKHINYINDKK